MEKNITLKSSDIRVLNAKGSNNIVVFLTNPEYYLPLQHE